MNVDHASDVKLPPPIALCQAHRVGGASVGGLKPGHARQRLREAGFQVADQANRSTARRRTALVVDLPDWSDGTGLDRHDPDLQRDPAATASAAGRANPRPAAGNRFDGRRDPGLPADHRAGLVRRPGVAPDSHRTALATARSGDSPVHGGGGGPRTGTVIAAATDLDDRRTDVRRQAWDRTGRRGGGGGGILGDLDRDDRARYV